MSDSSPQQTLFYFVLLVALLGAAAWHYWGAAAVAARSQPLATGAAAPAGSPGPAAPAAALQPGLSASNPPSSPNPPAPGPRPAAELARRIAESQNQAILLYPDLGTPNTRLNASFVARYKRLQADHSPRLQDPDWPMQLAAESAAAAGLRVVPPASGSAPPPALAPALAPAARPPAAPAPIAAMNTAARVPAAAPAAPPTAFAGSDSPPLISLDVRPMNAGSNYNVHWLSYYYGYDLQGKTSKSLDLDARNLSAHASQVTLEWIFTAHKHAQGNRTIFDMGSGNWDMQPNQSTHFGVRSASLSNRTVWYYDYGYGHYEGSEFDGWLVIARYKDKVLRAVGSSGTLESLVGTPEFDTMVSTYKAAHPGGGTPPPGTAASR